MRLAILASAGAAVALVAGACGDEPASGSDGISSADIQDAGMKYARCMREHGIDMPDPQPGPTGLRKLMTDSELRSQPGYQDASDACRKHLTSLASQITPDQKREMQQARLDFARCMRGEGIDVPDPQPGAGPNGGGGLLGKLDQDDPRVQRAMDKCTKPLPRVLDDGK
jgi:hypothetical protein